MSVVVNTVKLTNLVILILTVPLLVCLKFVHHLWLDCIQHTEAISKQCFDLSTHPFKFSLQPDTTLCSEEIQKVLT